MLLVLILTLLPFFLHFVFLFFLVMLNMTFFYCLIMLFVIKSVSQRHISAVVPTKVDSKIVILLYKYSTKIKAAHKVRL